MRRRRTTARHQPAQLALFDPLVSAAWRCNARWCRAPASGASVQSVNVVADSRSDHCSSMPSGAIAPAVVSRAAFNRSGSSATLRVKGAPSQARNRRIYPDTVKDFVRVPGTASHRNKVLSGSDIENLKCADDTHNE